MHTEKRRHVIVTGGSKGIGRAVAARFVEDGSRVLLLARCREQLQEAAKALSGNGPVDTRACDVSDPTAVSSLVGCLQEDFGSRIDVLVAAAGIYGPIGLFEEADPAEWLQVFATNVLGTMLMCKLVVPFMKKQKGGRIITFSGGGDGPFPRFAPYAASKGAITRFTESLAEEVREYGITINAIAPGAVNTSLLEEVIAAGENKAGRDFYMRSLEQKVLGGVSPQKAADLVMFLTSSAAGKITGKVLSAVHDAHDVLLANAEDIAKSDIYNVRRLKPKDRGFAW